MTHGKDHKFGMAPVYVGLYPDLANIAKSHGYALAVHGSVNRDFDLIAVPWVEEPAPPQMLIDEICKQFDIKQNEKPTLHHHDRMVYTLLVAHFGECFLDFSFIGISKHWFPEYTQKRG